jgi:signal transduction histidine kinase
VWVFELAIVVDSRRAAVLHALLNDALTAREAERRRIARELQAETAQSLVSLLVALRTVEESHDLGQAAAAASQVRGLVSAALENVQRLACGLDPGSRSPPRGAE